MELSASSSIPNNFVVENGIQQAFDRKLSETIKTRQQYTGKAVIHQNVRKADSQTTAENQAPFAATHCY